MTVWVLAAVAAAVAGCTSSSGPAPRPVRDAVRPLRRLERGLDTGPTKPLGTATGWTTARAGVPAKQNVVFVLTDDLSDNLVRFMPHVEALMQRGMSFDDYTVTNSLCCPSRASIFTGEFPHNTGVLSNVAPQGGYESFQSHDDASRTFAVALNKAGYRTAMLGKYLNDYAPVPPGSKTVAVPPGWSSFGGVDDGGYRGYRYHMAANHHQVYFGTKPGDYMTTVLDEAGQHLIRSAAKAKQPFLLELATFAPHHPFTPAPSDRRSFAGLDVPHGPTWGKKPKNAPRWLASRPPLTPAQIALSDTAYRLRVEDVQAVDRMVEHLENTLRATGELHKTVFVFSSDNGFHIGEYGLLPGKLTAFETDIQVPLVVTGPGIAAGSVNHDEVQNIDLAPTFEQLAGAPIPSSVDGHSFAPLLYGSHEPWRTFAEIEHARPVRSSDDPDEQSAAAGLLPSYHALRTATYTYVQYADGEHEYYDRVTDPNELDNVYASLTPARQRALTARVAAIAACHGAGCWTAAVPRG